MADKVDTMTLKLNVDASEVENTLAELSIDRAFDHHMRALFQSFLRHAGGGGKDSIDNARKQFRKDLAAARQARSEMKAIAGE